jgi:hypothetical protein
MTQQRQSLIALRIHKASFHALQPEQLIAKLPPEYYVVLPEVNADLDIIALEHCCHAVGSNIWGAY